jgi:hypothetical protein
LIHYAWIQIDFIIDFKIMIEHDSRFFNGFTRNFSLPSWKPQ